LVEFELQLLVGFVTSDPQLEISLEIVNVVNEVDVGNDAQNPDIFDRESTWLRAASHMHVPRRWPTFWRANAFHGQGWVAPLACNFGKGI
jgi:hypothetical protein